MSRVVSQPIRPARKRSSIRSGRTEEKAIPFVGDIAEMSVAEELVRTTLDAYGGLDVLVCAQGILRERMVFNMTEDDWDGVIQAHLKGCFAVTRFASIVWRQQRESTGRIIYFTSDAGISGGARPGKLRSRPGRQARSDAFQRAGPRALRRDLELRRTAGIDSDDRPRPWRRRRRE